MQRGSNVLYKDVFFDQATATVIPLKLIKGRSQELNQKRNECIIARYYFMGNGGEKSFDWLIKQVANQFFLSEHTVRNVILANRKILKTFQTEKFPKNYFEKKWPHLVW